MLTWIHEDAAIHSPVLLVTSPQPESGKTTLLKVVSFLARRGLASVSITGPALFRSIEKWAPTFVIDEADTAFVSNDDLKEVVNSGWTRGDCVIRCDPETHEPRAYGTFCPKMIGMIGRKLPPATLSRALIVALQRKKPDEWAADFDHCDNNTFAKLRAQLARWAADEAEPLAKAKPEMLPDFHNRTRANWRLLLAIAERCGAKQAAWKAAKEIEQVQAASDPSIGLQLLSDIRDAFDRLGKDRIATKELIAELILDPERPWATYGGRNRDKPITDRQLSRLLKEFNRGLGITPRTVRLGSDDTARGYYRSDFDNDFAAYLSPVSAKTASQSDTTTSASDFNHLGAKNADTSAPGVSSKNDHNSLKNNNNVGVSPESPVFADTEGTRGPKDVPSLAQLIGRASPGERCWLCGKAGGVCLIRRRSGEEPSQVHPGCAATAWAGDVAQPEDAPEDRTCVHCRSLVDGAEQLCSVDGRLIWLHPECQGRFTP